MIRFANIMLGTAALAFAAPALAGEATELAEGTIVVLAPEYAEGRITSATKTETPLIDVPQAISVITRDLIEDMSIRSMADIVRYVPGVTIGQGEGHRDQVTLRGQNSTADFFVDGVRDDVQYFRSLYNIDRVEVLKGPNAMIFGRGGGGGVINRVSKTPKPEAFNAFAASIDTYGSAFIEGDVNAPLSDTLAVRLNGFYERLDNHRDAFDGDRFAFNPTASLALGDKTAIGLSYEYIDDERVVDRGVPSANGRPLGGFRDAFFGARGINTSTLAAHMVKLTTRHRFSDAVRLTNTLSYGDFDKFYANAFAATPVLAGSIGIEAYRDATQRKSFFSQTDLVWTTGSHTILAGSEFGDQDTANQRLNGFFASGARRIFVPLADPLNIPPITFRAGTGNRSVRTDAEVMAFYVQDQIVLGDHFDVVAGIRYDRFRLKVNNVLDGSRVGRSDSLWSPRLGLVYKPAGTASLYASYSRSYLPQSGDQFLSLDLTAAALKPETFNNYEVGVKWDIREDLNLTAALYRLDRSNTRAAGPVPGSVVLTGAQRSKGLEIGLNGKITPAWRISAGYTLQNAEIRRATSAAPAGRDIPQVPRHQASLWNHYDISDRLGLGLGIYHQSKSFASISNAVTLPSFTRVDAAVFAVLSDNIEAQINVENLLGARYYPTAHSDNNISTGGPTAARLTLRTRF